ncbi:putative SPF1-P-type ATPase [Ceraceosorus guamensis]|uniref:Putative SPF1-P-type ATPase n=1 Tax=Ceraceosorus guamensis TaxID=1522189 RepID=A0A316W6Q8_9BASI|nr:putative SPF1-P-type ATPase [Ceraceosorus guamensis]PWN43325.1 putative SPF1-P-type ATPase [Ceraceosorus guamensis]
MAPAPPVTSPDIARLTLHKPIPIEYHLYTTPFALFYPLLAYAYFIKYDSWIKSEEWTFIFVVGLVTSHALSFLITKWSIGARALLTCRPAKWLQDASIVRVFPHAHKGEGELVPLSFVTRKGLPQEVSFTYQADKYILTQPDAKAPVTSVHTSPLVTVPTFRRLPYPADSQPTLSAFQSTKGHASEREVEFAEGTFGKNLFDIPRPTFLGLFAEHAVAPFFVFQIFCVGLWMLDEYWYYSLFTLFMLVVFEATVVFQRLRTLNEFRTMSIQPYQIQVHRAGAWKEVSTTELLPGDVVSVTRSKEDSATPCDLLLLGGSAIVNEAMLSGESTPLLKEGIELREGSDKLDVNGNDRNNVVFGGTKVLQTTAPGAPGAAGEAADLKSPANALQLKTPDGGAAAVVLRTGFGTTQGQLIRLMVFTNEGRVSANNLEAFLFIGFLLIFAIAASWYVWTRGMEMGRPKGKLLLDCVLIITSVVPPELPMELSMAVNTSLMALAKFSIFCTEPFRIPYAGRVDVCCFDKTGTITGEDLEVQGVAQVGARGPADLINLKDTSKETTLTLASAHALVLLDDGVVGDPMEKTTLDALQWTLNKGDQLAPSDIKTARHRLGVNVRRRFQFSSALKRMSTLSFVQDNTGSRRLFASVKGAPETLRSMYKSVPAGYDETFKGFTRRGSRVLALGYKYVDGVQLTADGVNNLGRGDVESGLEFAGFLVFHCPLKPDAKQTLKALNDSSHRSIMITGDNPLTAVHVATEVEIVDRETLILDVREGSSDEKDLVWRTVDERKIIPVRAEDKLDETLFDTYDICMTGVALRQFVETNPQAWQVLVQNTWVYARVSPAQKELILNTLKGLGYVTLMAGDGTNDVGALKAANIGIALLDGTPEDLKKIFEHQRNERNKKIYESQLKLTSRWGQPPPPVPAALKELYPELEKARDETIKQMQRKRVVDPTAKFDLSTLTASMADMDTDADGPPQIKLGDASVAAPFTSKLSNVAAITHVIRQGRCSLVSTVQQYKILGLNCLIQAYSLSVMYLDGIKYGDYQVTISGMLMSVCFLMISRAQPNEKLSKERPLANIFNFYIIASILGQFALHIASMRYITQLVPVFEEQEKVVDLEKKFSPSLLNTAVFLIGLSQQVSTVISNFIGQPWRESLWANTTMRWSLLGAFGVAFGGALEIMPELNEWLQLIKIPDAFKLHLVAAMIVDFAGSHIIEEVTRRLLAPRTIGAIVAKGRERREARRKAELTAQQNLAGNLQELAKVASQRKTQ